MDKTSYLDMDKMTGWIALIYASSRCLRKSTIRSKRKEEVAHMQKMTLIHDKE